MKDPVGCELCSVGPFLALAWWMDGSDDDDDELMLNVLRCHLTY